MVLPLGRHAAFGTFEWWWVAPTVGLIAGLIAACGVDLGRGFGVFAAGSAYEGVMSFGQCLPQVPSASFPPSLLPNCDWLPVMSVSAFLRPAQNPNVSHPRLTTTTGRAFFPCVIERTSGVLFPPTEASFPSWIFHAASMHQGAAASAAAPTTTERGVGFSKLRNMGNYSVQTVQPVTTAF